MTLLLPRILPFGRGSRSDATWLASQVVFTEILHPRVHLDVKALADVFLDTPLYNGHGTATDALWAALPLVTLAEGKMASRAAASYALASATGATTVVRDIDDYVRVAVALGRRRGVREALRWRLLRERVSSPVFDAPTWVAHALAAFKALWSVHVEADGKPMHVVAATQRGAHQRGPARGG